MPQLEREMASEKIIVLTGMRRVGKTTLIKLLYNQEIRRKLYLDLENPLNQSYFTPVDYDGIKSNLERTAVGTSKEMVVFLDEIQNVRHLPSIVKYLSDHYQYKFVLTGSASFYLKNLFSESLSGRKRVYELFPLTFEEFLNFKAPQISKPTLSTQVTPQLYQLLEKYISEYITYGGFPSVVTRLSHDEKLSELKDIFTSYFQKEVRLLSDFRKLTAVRSTMLLLMDRVGSKLDLSKISSELGVSRITVGEYLDFLEGTYFLARISPFSANADVRLRGQAKPYLCDNGFLAQKNAVQAGVLLENAVFNLLRHQGTTFYYQTKARAEIDFVLSGKDHLQSFEVKLHAHQTDVNHLKKLSDKLGIGEYFVISQKFSPLPGVVYPFQL